MEEVFVNHPDSQAWTDLPYFLAIARTGSLRAAADAIGSNHATVRRRLGALEDCYGAKLFERSVDGFSLTPAGQEILPRAEAAEREIIAASRQLAGLDSEAAGRVRVTMPPSLAYDVLAPLFAEFANLHPDIELDVDITNRIQDLGRHEADVSVRVAYEVSDDVVGRRVITYAKGIYASKRYIDEHRDGFDKEGQGLNWIGWGDKSPNPQWVRESPFPKAVLRHNIAEGSLHVPLVRAGMGMSHLPCFAASEHPELQLVPGTRAKLDRSIWLLLHADLQRTTRVRLFVDYLAEKIRQKRADFLGPLS